VALEDFRQGLGARLGRGVAGGHAVADVEVGDDVDREMHLGIVPQPPVGDGADAAFGVAGVEVHQGVGVEAALGVVEAAQLGGEQAFRPRTAVIGLEPSFARVMHEAAPGLVLGIRPAQVVVVPEVVAGQALEILAQGAGQGRQPGGALAVGEHERAVPVAQVHRPDAVDGVEPGTLLHMEAEGFQLGPHGGDGGFEGGVFAGDEAF
jgi:hypothetical protein